MDKETNLVWFGCVLFVAVSFLLFNLLHQQQEVKESEQDKIAKQMEELRQEYLRLQQQMQQQSSQLLIDFRHATFSQLQTLLINYPSVRQMTEAKPDLPAKNLISLFAPLDNILATWGYEPIGCPWEQVQYNPQLHQADSSDIREGELVYIRFIGYREGVRILCPAKVSRKLPSLPAPPKLPSLKPHPQNPFLGE
jgi:molecular chaperone GrpE (heat shock protein)